MMIHSIDVNPINNTGIDEMEIKIQVYGIVSAEKALEMTACFDNRREVTIVDVTTMQAEGDVS